jgi:hypothetical protein
VCVWLLYGVCVCVCVCVWYVCIFGDDDVLLMALSLVVSYITYIHKQDKKKVMYSQ